MKKLLFFLYLFSTSVFVAPHAALAQTQSAPAVDFVRNQIWFSKQPFRGGEQVKVYTSVLNGSTADTRGSVEFYDDQTLLGSTQFSVLSGGSQIVWVRWLATSGEHHFRAKITSIRATYPDGREQDLADIQTVTPVSVVVLEALPPVPKGSQPSALSGFLDTLGGGPLLATSTTVGSVVRGAHTLVSAADAALNTLQARLDEEEARVDKEQVASSVSGTGGKVVAASVSTAIASLDTPFQTLYSYLLHSLTFILDYKTLVYLISVYLLYKLIRLSIRRFFRPAV